MKIKNKIKRRMTERISLRLLPKDREKLIAIADIKKLKEADIARNAILEFLERYESAV